MEAARYPFAGINAIESSGIRHNREEKMTGKRETFMGPRVRALQLQLLLVAAAAWSLLALTACDGGGKGGDADVAEEAEGDIDGISEADPGDPDLEPEADPDAEPEAEPEEDLDVQPDEDMDVEEDGTAGTTIRIVHCCTLEGLADVLVMVQDGHGDRTYTTDASGEAEVMDVDVTADPPTISLFADGFASLTLVEVDQPLTTLPEALLCMTPSTFNCEPVELSGTVSGLGATDYAFVFPNSFISSGGSPEEAMTTGSYTINMYPSPDWTEVIVDAVAVHANVMINLTEESVSYSGESSLRADLRFPTPAADLDRATVTVALPVGFDAWPAEPVTDALLVNNYATPFAWDGTRSRRLGIAESVVAAAAPVGLDITVAWPADLGGAAPEDFYVGYLIAATPTWSAGVNLFPRGTPVDGDTLQIPDPPELTTPASPDASFSVSADTAAWTAPGWANETYLVLMSSSLQILWQAVIPPAITSFRFPTLPTGVSPLPENMRLVIQVIGREASPVSPYDPDTVSSYPTAVMWDRRYDNIHP
jgi:hypothetical protein